jgi:hypothetical protein
MGLVDLRMKLFQDGAMTAAKKAGLLSGYALPFGTCGRLPQG